MPVLGDREDVFPFFNNTGAQIANNLLIAITGYNAPTRSVTGGLAVASGINRRADGILVNGAVGNQRKARVYREWILENVNTAGRAVEDPVYLHPVTPGSWTFTRPSGTGQDVQQVGVVLSVSATAGRIAFHLSGAGVLGEAPGSITSDRLADKMYHDIGTAAHGWIAFTGNVADGDRVTIGGRVYEFDTNGVIGVGANIAVDVSAGVTAPDATAALVLAINGDASRVVNAANIGGNVVGLVHIAVDTAFAISNTVDAGGTIEISAATSAEESTETPHSRVQRSHTMTAAEITQLARTLGTDEVTIGGWPFATSPTLMSVTAWTAAGRLINLDGAAFTLRQAGAGFWTLCYAENAAGALLAAGDRIVYELDLED